MRAQGSSGDLSNLLRAFLSIAFGAILAATLNYVFWKRQHREEMKSLEEREKRLEQREMQRDRLRAVQRLREIGILLIESNRGTLLGTHVEQTQVTTANYLEIYRLRRELLSAVAAAREAFPDQQHWLLTAFERKITKTVSGLSDESAKSMHAELDEALAELTETRAEVPSLVK
jgi:hypothetical protein